MCLVIIPAEGEESKAGGVGGILEHFGNNELMSSRTTLGRNFCKASLKNLMVSGSWEWTRLTTSTFSSCDGFGCPVLKSCDESLEKLLSSGGRILGTLILGCSFDVFSVPLEERLFDLLEILNDSGFDTALSVFSIFWEGLLFEEPWREGCRDCWVWSSSRPVFEELSASDLASIFWRFDGLADVCSSVCSSVGFADC